MSWTDTSTGEVHQYNRNEKGYLNAVADIQIAVEANHSVDARAKSILYEAKALGISFVTIT